MHGDKPFPDAILNSNLIFDFEYYGLVKSSSWLQITTVSANNSSIISTNYE